MIRTARPDECEAVAAAYDWLFAPPGGPVPGWDRAVAAERLRAVLADQRSTVLVSEGLTGFCTVYLDIVSVRFGQRAWVEDLAVHPGRRSAGIGSALLAAARSWARARGATHLELDSAFTRTDAHRFYEREGPAWSSRSFGYLL
jgi:GNAT superfamily N-acetyltransferase